MGRGMLGVDCSVDVHAREISCVLGRCIISKSPVALTDQHCVRSRLLIFNGLRVLIACESGFSLALENNTCILE